MQIHWPLIISTVCQRVGLGAFIFAYVASALFGLELPMNVVAIFTLALLAIGGVASIFHLKRPQRFFNAFSNMGSHLTQEALITPFLGIALLVCVLNGLIFEVGSATIIVDTVTAVLALAFLVCTGLAYQMGSRPAWNTPFVLALFLLTALEAGGIAVLVFCFVLNITAPLLLIASVLVCTAICITTQIAYVIRMRGVGYGVAINAFDNPYRFTFVFWIISGAALPLIGIALCLVFVSSLVAICSLLFAALGIAAWTVLFFKGALKVKMFPMYSVDLNLDM